MKTLKLMMFLLIGLSIQFAKMEYKLLVIITGMIGTENNLIAITLIGKNNLSQNIKSNCRFAIQSEKKFYTIK